MKIHLINGSGCGATSLSAFDSALDDAGVANYNLIRLSSVIPPGANLISHKGTIKKSLLPGGWGDRLYVVMAEKRTSVKGENVCAGIGWVQDPISKKGLFVEHEGNSESLVRKEIELSLETLSRTRGINFGPIKTMIKSVQCKNKPVSALVIAVYQSSDWNNQASFCK